MQPTNQPTAKKSNARSLGAKRVTFTNESDSIKSMQDLNLSTIMQDLESQKEQNLQVEPDTNKKITIEYLDELSLNAAVCASSNPKMQSMAECLENISQMAHNGEIILEPIADDVKAEKATSQGHRPQHKTLTYWWNQLQKGDTEAFEHVQEIYNVLLKNNKGDDGAKGETISEPLASTARVTTPLIKKGFLVTAKPPV